MRKNPAPMWDRLLRGAAVLAAGLALVAPGCGGDEAETRPQGHTVRVYSSLPLEGGSSRRQAAAIVAGIRLALADRRGRAGDLRVEYRSLNNASPGDGGPEPGIEAGNARTAAHDDAAVAYIGSISFEATAISIPILNERRMVQVSPAATYDGLTKATPAAQRGEPEKYYPTEERNFARLVPIDSLQARALAAVMAEAGCRDAFTAVAADTASGALGRALVRAGSARGIRSAGQVAVDSEEPDIDDVARLARESAASCAVLVAPAEASSVLVLEQIAAALPRARLFGSDGICRSAFASPATGVARAVGDRATCTAVVRDVDSYPGAGRVDTREPHALYGYEAMSLILDAVERAGGDREAVRAAVMGTRARRSPIGAYGLDADGDTSLAEFGVYRMAGGRLRLDRVTRPTD